MASGTTSTEVDPPVLREASAPEPPPSRPELPLRLAAAPTPAPDRGPGAILLPRPHPWLVVVDDDSPAAYAALTWALREAGRREATVIVVAVSAGTASSRDLRAALDERVERAVTETGCAAPVQTAVLDATVLAALTGAARGADLVIVGTAGKTLLRPAVPRTAGRRLARGA